MLKARRSPSRVRHKSLCTFILAQINKKCNYIGLDSNLYNHLFFVGFIEHEYHFTDLSKTDCKVGNVVIDSFGGTILMDLAFLMIDGLDDLLEMGYQISIIKYRALGEHFSW